MRAYWYLLLEDRFSAVAVPRAMPSTKRKIPHSHEKPVRAYPLNSFSLNIGQQDAHFYAQSGKMTLKVPA
jgi:hypothetical protein